MTLYSVELQICDSFSSNVWLCVVTCSMLHFGAVMNRFTLLWSFGSMKSSFMLCMSCSFLPAAISLSSVLQKFSYWGLVKNRLNLEKTCFSLVGIPPINPNMQSIMRF
jgi:hypothetical protein